jgi:hypothetical protein
MNRQIRPVGNIQKYMKWNNVNLRTGEKVKKTENLFKLFIFNLFSKLINV